MPTYRTISLIEAVRCKAVENGAVLEGSTTYGKGAGKQGFFATYFFDADGREVGYYLHDEKRAYWHDTPRHWVERFQQALIRVNGEAEDKKADK